ncbi:hypothetical protein FA15DRAFT_701125 [Coprinopsis marcescibilis]|uniref:Uncharacterized protein n=1 Tax=Coprinopsis marcescibilis TaxID=230819 RepID=A0A5C3L5E0_COPMA|nr:hypothetical protein FA15DRAFT_701125 [Coprinopsis marcescibilis]
MPKGSHHCADPKKKGCNGMVISGKNCPKCRGYKACTAGCGQYTAFGGKCPACVAASRHRSRSFQDLEERFADEDLLYEARSYESGKVVCFRTI